MIYQEGMLCKHFKGETLLEKNIYRIIRLNVLGTDVDTSKITYTGDGILQEATDLVLYQNIFQDNKYFVREYSDISSELSIEKQEQFHQSLKVQPLTEKEIEIVLGKEFASKKLSLMKKQ